MADTPNHNYNVPDQGDQDWHQPLNENFEEFEVDIELRDQEGNLGDYDPTDGAKFLATDTGVVYLGDGTDWNATFLVAEYDDSTGEATISGTLATSKLDVGSISGSLTGGTELSNIAGSNLSIDSNGTLNASGGGGGGGGGISSLTGGDGIEPGSIGDGDTLSVAWGDANDLDGSGNVTGGGGGGGGISSLTGGEGIDPASIGDSDTLSVAWGDANDLDASGGLTRTIVESLNGGDGIAPGTISDGDTLSVAWGDANDLDGSGNVTGGGGGGGGISSLTGGDGIEPGSIGDGDTLSVAWGDANDFDGSGNLTGGYWTPNNNLLEPADSNIDGIDVDALTCSSTIDAGGLNVGSGNINGDKITGRVITARDGVLTQEISSQGAGLGIGTSNPSASLDVNGDVDADDVATPSINANGDALGIGTDSPSTPLDVQGQSNWDLDNNDGDFRIGNDDYRLAMGVALGGGGAGNAAIRAKGGNALKLGAGGRRVLSIQADESNSQDQEKFKPVPFLGIGTDNRKNDELIRARSVGSNGAHLVLDVANPIAQNNATVDFEVDGSREATVGYAYENEEVFLTNPHARLYIDSNGDLNLFGGNKNFVQSVDTDDGQKEVVYTSTEAPTARTEATGVAKLEDGRAEIELPEHFGWVTDDDEPIHVQTTPHSADSGGLAAVERTSDRLVIEDRDGDGDYEFSYTVKGTRDGYADKEVVREPTARDSAEPSQSASPADD
jgi:hypothetical protein